MGVDVVLAHVDQRGSSPKGRRVSQVDAVLDNQDRFVRLCAASTLPMLGRVDPYGTLVLTSQEMAQFIAEIESEVERVEDFEVENLLRDVMGIARECESSSVLELHLEGD